MTTNIDTKIYDPVAQLIASGGSFTPNSIPGSSIQNGTITNTQLAPGAAANNINSGPPGAVNATQIGNGITGSQLAAGAAANNINSGPPGAVNATQIGNGITGTQLAPGAAASNINSGPPGAINQSQIAGGPFLPLSGGTMSGAIIQPIAPVNPNDLTNKAYVDAGVSNKQDKKALATPGHLAVWGTGADTGQTVDSGITLDDTANTVANLYSASKINQSLRFGWYVIVSTGSVVVPAFPGTENAFSAGFAQMGPENWPITELNDDSTFSVASDGTVTIINNDTLPHYYRATFINGTLNEATGSAANLACQFVNTTGAPVTMGIAEDIRNLAGTSPQFTNTVFVTVTIKVNPGPSGSFSFVVRLVNLGSTAVTLDPPPSATVPPRSTKLIIERVS